MSKTYCIVRFRAIYCLLCIICAFTVVLYIFIEFEDSGAFEVKRKSRGFSKGILNKQYNHENDLRYPREFCNCEKHKFILRKKVDPLSNGLVSSCSKEATELGKGQKVITISLYKPRGLNTFPYLGDIDLVLAEIQTLFPRWVVRIYSNATLGKGNEACKLICKKDFIFWCDITNIPGHGNMSSLDPRTWRFLVLDDPSVDRFLSRDLDYQFTRRERVAVAEWEASAVPFHTMRDHPYHNMGMLGGMWGAKNYLLPPDLRKNISKSIIAAAKRENYKGYDQEILRQYVYEPYCDTLVLAHDSYNCDIFSDFMTLPYSVQRQGGEMIGLRRLGNASTIRICPLKCRPEHGKDWERC